MQKGKSIQQVDKETVIKLYDEFYLDVVRLAFSYVKSQEDSMDIAQNVFLKLISSNAVLFPGSEKSWLLTVTANECRNHLKKYRPAEELSESIPADEKDREVWHLLDTLSPDNRAVIQLHYYDGYSVEEIAKILHISRSGVSMRLSRARKKLKKVLEEDYE